MSEYTIYKPTKSQTGGAIKFNVQNTGKFSFMKAASQIAAIGSSRMFGWQDDDAINVKMGLNDLGAILTVIEGYASKDGVKLFHKTDSDNKIIVFKHEPERFGYSLSVSHKKHGSSEPHQVFIGISYPEAMILKIYIEHTIREMLEAAVWSSE